MFLIYGASDCQFCHKAKCLLNDSNMEFTYVNLTDMYQDGWRQVFTDLAHLINGQTKIPLIFKSEPGVATSLVHKGRDLTGWTFVGNYFDLEDLLDNMDLSVDAH